jgi:hypothetical protein
MGKCGNMNSIGVKMKGELSETRLKGHCKCVKTKAQHAPNTQVIACPH